MTTAMVTEIARGRKVEGSEVSKERIGPRRAAELLTLNHSNRNIRKSVVGRYVQDMVAGRWDFNGAPIIISDTNILIDGQHRLTAVVEAGVTLDFIVIYGAPESTRYTVDQGTVRQPGDILTFAGVDNGAAIAAVARIVMSRQAGLTTTSGFRPSNAAIRQWVSVNPAVADSAEVYRQARRQVPVSPSIAAAAWFLCAEVDGEAANDFFIRRFINTEGLTANDPVKSLRKRLAEMTGRDGAALKAEQLRYIILAWNIDREGRKVTKLQAPKGGWTRSNFPEPK